MNEYVYDRLTPQEREYLSQLHIEREVPDPEHPDLPEEERCRRGWNILDRARMRRQRMEGREISMPEMFVWARSVPFTEVLGLADGEPEPLLHS